MDSGTPEEAAGLAEAGVEVSLDVDGTELLDEVKTVVKSPGVPQDAPAVAAARERGLEVTGELELAWRAIPNPLLRDHRHQRQDDRRPSCSATSTARPGLPVAVAGNVGTPLASLAGGPWSPTRPSSASASSFQLEDSSAFAPECAVLLNLAPDHLDRHGTMEDYLAAKLRIFANQGNDDVAVYNGAEPELRDRDLGGCARRVRFCPVEAPRGRRSRLRAEPARRRALLRRRGPDRRSPSCSCSGAHNVENAMAAAAAALATGIDRGRGRRGAAQLRGRPAPPGARARARRRPLRQRLQGDQRRLGAGGDRGRSTAACT